MFIVDADCYGIMSFEDMKGILNVYFKGDMEAAPALAGQSAGLIGSVKTAKEIIEDTVAEFMTISSRMGRMAQNNDFA